VSVRYKLRTRLSRRSNVRRVASDFCVLLPLRLYIRFGNSALYVILPLLQRKRAYHVRVLLCYHTRSWIYDVLYRISISLFPGLRDASCSILLYTLRFRKDQKMRRSFLPHVFLNAVRCSFLDFRFSLPSPRFRIALFRGHRLCLLLPVRT
jgi:hypothetical protein